MDSQDSTQRDLVEPPGSYMGDQVVPETCFKLSDNPREENTVPQPVNTSTPIHHLNQPRRPIPAHVRADLHAIGSPLSPGSFSDSGYNSTPTPDPLSDSSQSGRSQHESRFQFNPEVTDIEGDIISRYSFNSMDEDHTSQETDPQHQAQNEHLAPDDANDLETDEAPAPDDEDEQAVFFLEESGTSPTTPVEESALELSRNPDNGRVLQTNETMHSSSSTGSNLSNTQSVSRDVNMRTNQTHSNDRVVPQASQACAPGVVNRTDSGIRTPRDQPSTRGRRKGVFIQPNLAANSGGGLQQVSDIASDDSATLGAVGGERLSPTNARSDPMSIPFNQSSRSPGRSHLDWHSDNVVNTFFTPPRQYKGKTNMSAPSLQTFGNSQNFGRIWSSGFHMQRQQQPNRVFETGAQHGGGDDVTLLTGALESLTGSDRAVASVSTVRGNMADEDFQRFLEQHNRNKLFEDEDSLGTGRMRVSSEGGPYQPDNHMIAAGDGGGDNQPPANDELEHPDFPLRHTRDRSKSAPTIMTIERQFGRELRKISDDFEKDYCNKNDNQTMLDYQLRHGRNSNNRRSFPGVIASNGAAWWQPIIQKIPIPSFITNALTPPRNGLAQHRTEPLLLNRLEEEEGETSSSDEASGDSPDNDEVDGGFFPPHHQE